MVKGGLTTWEYKVEKKRGSGVGFLRLDGDGRLIGKGRAGWDWHDGVDYRKRSLGKAIGEVVLRCQTITKEQDSLVNGCCLRGTKKGVTKQQRVD